MLKTVSTAIVRTSCYPQPGPSQPDPDKIALMFVAPTVASLGREMLSRWQGYFKKFLKEIVELWRLLVRFDVALLDERVASDVPLAAKLLCDEKVLCEYHPEVILELSLDDPPIIRPQFQLFQFLAQGSLFASGAHGFLLVS